MTRKWLLLSVVPVVVCVLLLAWWWRGGNEASRAYVNVRTGGPSRFGARLFYRGFKIPGTGLVVLKRYYAIAEKDPHTGISTGVEYKGEGYNSFFVFYEDGTIAAEGMCRVERNDHQILHNIHDVKEGRFYNPRGDLVSSIRNGTGIQTFFYPDGTKSWELHLEDFRRKKLTMWNPDGSVSLEKTY